MCSAVLRQPSVAGTSCGMGTATCAGWCVEHRTFFFRNMGTFVRQPSVAGTSEPLVAKSQEGRRGSLGCIGFCDECCAVLRQPSVAGTSEPHAVKSQASEPYQAKSQGTLFALVWQPSVARTSEPSAVKS